MSTFKVKVTKTLPKRGSYYCCTEVDKGCLIWGTSGSWNGVSKVSDFVAMLLRSEAKTVIFNSEQDLKKFACAYGINFFGFTSVEQIISEVQRKLEIESQGGAVSQSCN